MLLLLFNNVIILETKTRRDAWVSAKQITQPAIEVFTMTT